MKTLETWASDYLCFSTDRSLADTITLIRMVRSEVLDTIVEMARKYNTHELLEFADRVEALKSLP